MSVSAEGDVHIAFYYSDMMDVGDEYEYVFVHGLKHVRKAGASWEIETVYNNKGYGAGYYYEDLWTSATEIGRSGRVHIAFFDSVNASLVYAVYSAGD
ncbi:MAG TPA: hypothetical protein ENF73_06825 [Proteobacteria bacterium]|nr:hypothetical protein [Pseudomonadota bacterium]